MSYWRRSPGTICFQICTLQMLPKNSPIVHYGSSLDNAGILAVPAYQCGHQSHISLRYRNLQRPQAIARPCTLVLQKLLELRPWTFCESSVFRRLSHHPQTLLQHVGARYTRPCVYWEGPHAAKTSHRVALLHFSTSLGLTASPRQQRSAAGLI